MNMIRIIIVSLLVAVAVGQDYEEMFEEFKITHMRAYASAAEEARRFRYFVENMKRAAELQATNPLATFGPNEFADMSAEEFAKTHLSSSISVPGPDDVPIWTAALNSRDPERIDWRERKAVSPVEDQGMCGSNWAFSAIGAIEGAWAASGNQMVPLSVQELVSCDKFDYNCDGGNVQGALDWLLEYAPRKGEVATKEEYPYQSTTGDAPPCDPDLAKMKSGAVFKAYNFIASTERDLAAWVRKNGPVAIAADGSSFQSYRSGILTDCISRNFNVALVVVGYDDVHYPPYWIVKNSWGDAWGEKGYIRVRKNHKECRIGEKQIGVIVKNISNMSAVFMTAKAKGSAAAFEVIKAKAPAIINAPSRARGSDVFRAVKATGRSKDHHKESVPKEPLKCP